MKIEVTREDIERGEPRSAYRCPVVLALRRATGRAWTVTVSVAFVWNIRYSERLRFELPGAASQFIIAFDFGHCGKPFSFEIDLGPYEKRCQPGGIYE